MSNPRTIYLLKSAEIEVRNLADTWLRDEGVTLAQYTALSLIQARTQTSAELARRLRMRPQSINEVVLRLEAMQLIERRAVPEDRRVRRIVLTPQGGTKMEKCEQIIGRLEDELLRNVGRLQRQALREALALVAAAGRTAASALEDAG